jgi:hypothetical protein
MIHPKTVQFLDQLNDLVPQEVQYPYKFSDLVMVKVFAFQIIEKIDSFKSLEKYLKDNPKVAAKLGMTVIPHRTTMADRYRNLPVTMLKAIDGITDHFKVNGTLTSTILSADSTLMEADGNIWHKKSMKENVIPLCGNIDIEAHWGCNGQGEWCFGYKAHFLVEYGEKKLRWPTTVAVTPGNIKDYHAFTMTLVSRMPSATKAILGDSGYNTEDVFKVVENKQAILMVPIKIKKNTAGWRKDRAEKIQSDDGKRICALRSITSEPFHEQFKTLFSLKKLRLKGWQNVKALVTMCTLMYCLLVLFNEKLKLPLMHLKATLLSLQ